jgi:Holliday junction resolvase RusA-like endonuclease
VGADRVHVSGCQRVFDMAQEVGRQSFLFWVHGRPAPQGSKTAYVIGGRAVMKEASKFLPAWRSAVTEATVQEIARSMDVRPFTSPVRLFVEFYIERPKNPKHKAFPGGKPDLDHLIRSVGDSLTRAGVLADDALIVDIQARKLWVGADTYPEPGAKVEITAL